MPDPALAGFGFVIEDQTVSIDEDQPKVRRRTLIRLFNSVKTPMPLAHTVSAFLTRSARTRLSGDGPLL
jgi:hypothetical protein